MSPMNRQAVLKHFSTLTMKIFEGSRDGAVVRTLASHQCGPGSIPGPGVICWLSLLSAVILALRGFCPGTPVFPRRALLKNQHFQIPIRSGAHEHDLTSF